MRADDARPLCRCHGVPMCRNGSHNNGTQNWWCALKTRERNAATYKQNREQTLARLRERYDTDPVYRIGKRLADDARQRQRRLANREERLMGGALQTEGRG